MATESNSEVEKCDEVDRISDLPDSLLCHILSFLQTKQTVATTTLSTRWKPVWTMVPSLDFQDTAERQQNQGDNHGNNDLNMMFTQFVCRVLALREPVPLKKFRLLLNPYYFIDPTRLHTWISYAIGHHVEEIHLFRVRTRSQPLELHPSLFSCKSLKTLMVHGEIIVNCPSSIHLPNLLCLGLLRIKYTDEESFHRLLTGSPNLQKLIVWRYQQDNMISFIISHPTLRLFFFDNQVQDPRFRLELNAPSLKHLLLWDRNCHGYLLHNVTNIIQANMFNLCEHGNFCNCMLKLLSVLPNVQSLTLRYNKPLGPGFYLPMFNNLRSLQLKVKCCKWQILLNLLQSAHNLETLTLNKMDIEGPHESCWIEPQEVPKCLESRLQSFYFVRFSFLDHELELVKYILKNAQVLKTMGIHNGVSNWEEEFFIRWEMLDFPRGSLTCQLEFLTVEPAWICPWDR